ncbi:Dipeptidyl carboxypeptidase Dcp [Collimonas arenae]|uniref:Dipeptidyl carboxypeptidase Dcp n=1 Tax=Collimonas arenae TaxID=279058 RepID=A0A0A1FH95_9BURK|nr:M3 family metallopeptidase [Collimonas arenae]AIY44153.1 Dipeptidyl carboxypeptidase Dcp [Collimonas arenae]
MQVSTRHISVCGLMLGAAAGLMGCDMPTKPDQSAAAATAAYAASSPFAQVSSLPYNLPPFDKIKDSDYKPSFEAGMAQQRQEVNAIAANPAAPTFDNTIVALERSGLMLTRVKDVFFNLISSNTSPVMDQTQQDIAPKLAEHEDAIFLDPILFARIETLYQQRASLGLDAESLRLLERYRTDFVRAGARLSPAEKDQLRKMNQQISSLTTQFQQNLLKASNDGAIVVDKVADLDGLSKEEIAAAAQAAETRKLDGKWLIPLQNTTDQPVLAQLKNRALRERIYKASISRGDGGAGDNVGNVAQIVKLRAQRAALLGYPNHAAYVLEEETAGTPAAVNKMLAQLAPPAAANARKEAAAMQQLIDRQAKAKHSKPFKLQPWDWGFYSEQVRKERYNFDESQIKPYFELNNVLQDGVFYAAHELYGLTFKERTDLPVYQQDVRVFEVFNADDSALGLFLFDPFARDNKQGGAWMNTYVAQSRLFGTKPVVSNNINIAKPPAGKPVLLSFDEVNTMFHEFGHALHGLFSNVEYPMFSGASVPPDFVEYPSQFNEMWSHNPKVLAHYAKHYETGKPMPRALVNKVLAARKFNAGYDTSEYLSAAILDQSWHQLSVNQTPDVTDVMAFEAKALGTASAKGYVVPPRYHTPYFQHVFASGYSAGYYAYIWSDVLAKDTEYWMNAHGGLKRANGDLLRAKVLSRGFSDDPSALFKDFYGRGPDVGPLLDARGLTAAAK